MIETQIATHGGKRRGAGRPLREDEVPLESRERLVIAKADREEHMAALAKMEVAEKEGRLIDADEARKQARRAGMEIRDAVLSIPGRVAALLAGMEDEREIERLLTEAIRAELTRIARTVLGDAV